MKRAYINTNWTFEIMPPWNKKVLQVKSLPTGIEFVIQDGWKGHFKKYASNSKSGTTILIGAGNTIKQAKENTLAQINKRLLEVAQTWSNPSIFDYMDELKKYY